MALVPWSDRAGGDDHADGEPRDGAPEGGTPGGYVNPAFQPIPFPPARKRPAELDDVSRRVLFGPHGMYAEGTSVHAIRLHEEIVKSLTTYARTLKWERPQP
jgi:hypothetical protein